MREFKFRFWKPEIKDWVSFPNHGIYSHKSLLDKVYLDNGYFIIQQYTGLQDKNGKDIYEGDIVDNEGGMYWKDVGVKQIRYGLDCGGDYPFAGFTIINPRPVDLDTGKMLDCMNCQFLTVIGNIFETPELLK